MTDIVKEKEEEKEEKEEKEKDASPAPVKTENISTSKLGRGTGVFPRVVVVGAGFGGLHVAQELTNSEVEVVVLDKNNYHGFWPLLYQVATAGLEPEAIAYPVRAILRKFRNVSFQVAEVTGVDFEKRQVLTKTGDPVDYDYLVLAAGSANNYFGNHELADNTLGLKDIDDAVRIRNRVLSAFEQAVREPDAAERRRLMTFVVIGGGPTGVELAGAFAELIRHVLRKDYPMLAISEARIVLVEASPNLLAAFPENLKKSARQQLDRMGVETHLNSPVASVEDNVITLKSGDKIEASTVIWAAGVRGATLGDALGVKLNRGARVEVEPTLNLPQHPEVFVIGDMAYLEGYKGKLPYPQVAPVAMQQGSRAAKNILAHIRGKQMSKFKYFDRGSMATIGRRSAIFDAFGIRLSGVLAWFMWLVVHILYLIGFRNRVIVMANWIYNYLTYDRAVRLISGLR
jgi:NADH dehydrogenase